MIGQSLGSYRIVDRLGEGGMGVVYVAEHELIGRKAAVKRLQPEYSNNKNIVDRFFNEARAAAMIKHPGIVQIFDFGYADDGSAYIVMEFLEGEGMTGRIERASRLPADEIYHLTRQAADALSAAHSAGIIHRDLKPDNIHIVPDSAVPGGERIKVLDFGIAKLLGDAPVKAKTRTGAMMGSPMYMSPEQCRGAGEVDVRADVYSLGCVMYHMATGRPPFLAEGVGEIIGKHIYEQPADPRDFAPDLPDALRAIILRALDKDPDERYASMDDLVGAIDEATGARFATVRGGAGFARAASSPAALAETATPVTTTLGSSAAEVAGPITAPGEGKRSWLLPLIAVVVIGGGAAVYGFTRGGDDGGAAEPTPAAAVEPATEPAVEPAAEPAAEPEKVTIEIESDPSGADVYNVATGVKIGTTPFSSDYERTDGELVVVLRRKGYESSELSIPLGADADETVTLDKRSRGKRGKRTTGKTETKQPKREPPTKTDRPESKWGETVNPLEDE